MLHSFIFRFSPKAQFLIFTFNAIYVDRDYAKKKKNERFE